MPDQFKNSRHDGEDRRKPAHNVWLTEEQIQIIAEKAADVAVKRMTDEAYRTIGKGVVTSSSKLLTVIGILATAAYYWAQSHGWIK